MRSRRAAALVFATSAVVLTLEILAGRLMAPYVGVSQETFTGIIGTMLAGIALGASVGGRLADDRDVRTLIGPALVLGGTLTWLSLPILRVLGPIGAIGPLGIVLLAAAAFLAPATVLSAIAPMVAKLQLTSLETSGSVVGRMSAAGTAGALVGTFVTGYVLVTAVPTRWVVIGIGGVTVAAGMVAIVRTRLAGKYGAGPLALVLLPAFGAAVVPSPCEHESAYFCIRVESDPERRSGRSLILDTTRHAYVDLDDPEHLELRYVRLIAAVLDATGSGPTDALHLGGGGFTVPAYLEATRPGSTNTVFEIDPVLVDVARDELGLDDDAMDIEIGDARLRIDDLDADTFDVVVGDAFASTSVPWHLTTVETMRSIGRALRPGGVYVMNVIDGGANRYARAQLATLAAEFDHVAAIVPAGGVPSDAAANQILIASDRPFDAPDVAAADGRYVGPDAITRFIDGARRLTDDFAPVDQMLFR